MKKLIIITAIVAMSAPAFAIRKGKGPRDKGKQEQKNIEKKAVKARMGTRTDKVQKSNDLAENIEKAYGRVGESIKKLANETSLGLIYPKKAQRMIEENVTSFLNANKLVKEQLESDKTEIGELKLETMENSKDTVGVVSELLQVKLSKKSTQFTKKDKEEVDDLVQLLYVMSYHIEDVVAKSTDMKTVKNFNILAKSINKNISGREIDVTEAVNKIIGEYLKLARGEEPTQAKIDAFKKEMKEACKKGVAA